ncbi:MAG: TCR/Tet family MFS transporter [Brevirhabdus sp.]
MRRLSFTFIIITLMIDAMGIGLIMPVMPDLIRDVHGGSLADAAVWGGIMATSFAVMQFLFGPTVGNLSDRFGRRPVLLVSLFVMMLDYLVMAVAGSIWLLLAGRVVGGITAATQSTATAFIADISSPEDKAKNFGLVGAAFGAGFVLGPLIGGLLGELGPRAPFYVAAALAFINMMLGYFVLPETVTDEIRRPFLWRRANPFGALAQLTQLPGLGRLLTIFFLYSVAFTVYPSIWAYFTRAKFEWEAGMVGLSLASFGISMALVQGVLIRGILPRLGEYRTVLLGLAFNVVALLCIGLISNGWLVLVLTPLTALGAIASPAMQGIMSRTASDDQQGELQGALTSIGALAMIISPLVMTRIFSVFTGPEAPINQPGAPFLLSALLIALCVPIFVTGVPKRHPA